MVNTKLVLAITLAMVIGFAGVVAGEPNSPPNMSVQIKIWSNQTTTLIYVNGVSLNDRIQELQARYNVLSNHLRQTDLSLYDYITLNEIKTRLLSLHQYAVQALYRELVTNTSLTDGDKSIILTEIARHNGQINDIQRTSDELLINLLMRYQKMLNTGEGFSYGGYHDVYGDFHYFKESSDQYLRDDVFRIIDCYSSLGQSKVLQGGWITVEGINSYGAGVSTTRGMWITYLDPALGIDKTFYTTHGLNMSTGDFKITWQDNVFKFSVKVDPNTPEGMKQVTFKRESPRGGAEYLRVSFDVVRPQLRVYTSVFDNKLGVSVRTNLDEVSVSYGGHTRVLTPHFGGVFTVFNRTASNIVRVGGTGEYGFVSLSVPLT